MVSIQVDKCSLRVCGIIGNGTRASKERARWFDCGIGNKGVTERYSFFEEDIHSRLQPGKRDTKTKNKVKQQLRYLVDAIRNLHLKFLQHPNVQVSYSTFLKHKPFWVIQPSIRCRETCQCKVHSNLQFKADQLKQLGAISTNNLRALCESVCCNMTAKACAYRECTQCKDKN